MKKIQTFEEPFFSSWVVDFDGTIIDLDLGYLFSKWIFNAGKIHRLARVLRLVFGPVNLLCRLCGYGQIIQSWSFFKSKVEIQKLINEFLEEHDSLITVNLEVVSLMSTLPCDRRVLLTGCPEELVLQFLKRRNLEIFDEVVGLTTTGSFIIARHPFARTKRKLALCYQPFAAIGDSWQDRFVLKEAALAYVIPGNQRLERLSAKEGWNVLEVNT